MKKINNRKFSNAAEQSCKVAIGTLVSGNMPPRINSISYYPVYLREVEISHYLAGGSICLFPVIMPVLIGNFILSNLC